MSKRMDEEKAGRRKEEEAIQIFHSNTLWKRHVCVFFMRLAMYFTSLPGTALAVAPWNNDNHPRNPRTPRAQRLSAPCLHSRTKPHPHARRQHASGRRRPGTARTTASLGSMVLRARSSMFSSSLIVSAWRAHASALPPCTPQDQSHTCIHTARADWQLRERTLLMASMMTACARACRACNPRAKHR